MKARDNRRIRSLAGTLALVAGSAWLSSGPARAIEFCSPKGTPTLSVSSGEIREGDVYVAAQTIDISGTQDGDLIGWAQNIGISGEVTGDLFVGGQGVTIQGRVGDSARVFCNSLVIQGEIDGDLLVFAQTVTIGPNAVVTGDIVGLVQILNIDGTVSGKLKTAGQTVNLRGAVEGDVEATVGEFELTGRIGGNAEITCDTLKVGPEAYVDGDLLYSSRKPLEGLEELDVVAGSIDFEEKVDEEEADGGGRAFSLSWLFWRLVFLGWSFVVGSVLIAIFRRQLPAVESAIEGETLASLGVGFVLALPLPVAALIVCLLVVTIPLSMITLALCFIGWYVAHLVVSTWAGRRLLSLVGWTRASPYLGLLLGLVLYKLLVWIPCFGFVVRFLAVFLGMGAIFLGARNYLRSAYPKTDTTARDSAPA
jgi:cytoskeletal protein CcmA (bactofilin family)